MIIDVLTLFPEMFSGVLNESIIKRAIDDGIVTVNLIDFRKYSLDSHHKVDDTPYGGGSGMVLMCEPIFLAVDEIKEKDKDAYVIMLSPDGVTYNEDVCKKLRDIKHLVLICGHYEGFDERIKSICDEVISIGDFVLTGGEIPAMAIIDSVTRILPGTIKEDSFVSDSFYNGLLDYPTYTKPRVFRGMEVPDVLLNGNHKEILDYRNKMSYNKTQEKRPDLLEKK